MKRILLLLLVLSGHVSAHEWTPTYPRMSVSHLEAISVTRMKLFNNRENVEYYEITVHDEDWNPVPYAVISNPVKVLYQEIEYVDVYIKNKDLRNAVYVCSKSKPYAEENTTKPMLFSRICSKIK